MRITADQERCIGAGMCVFAAPRVFDHDDDGRVVVMEAEPPFGSLQAVREAVDLCPSGALALESGE